MDDFSNSPGVGLVKKLLLGSAVRRGELAGNPPVAEVARSDSSDVEASQMDRVGGAGNWCHACPNNSSDDRPANASEKVHYRPQR